MLNFKLFSTEGLIQWFKNGGSFNFQTLIYLPPLAPQPLDTLLEVYNQDYKEMENHKLITEHYF